MGAALNTPRTQVGKGQQGFTKAYEGFTQGSYHNLRAHRTERITRIVIPGGL